MNRRSISMITLVLCFFAAVPAQALTLLQENLIGIPNRFVVNVSQIDGNGPMTQASVKTMVEQQVEALGVILVKDKPAPPIAYINVNIVQREEGGEKAYMIDLNVYNDSTIGTTYRLRKGTVWMMGSVKAVPGADFPRDVEQRISQLVQYFVQDYFAANPDAMK